MVKLALIGKDIAHSKSQKVYEELLGQSVEYQLLDIETEDQLPSLEELFHDLDGVSITAPYKNSYISHPGTKLMFKPFSAVNCVHRTEDGFFELYNTDYLAVRLIVQDLIKEFPSGLDPIILGAGNMANITSFVLDEFKIMYRKVSRTKEKPDLNALDFAELFHKTGQKLVINCCSREFIFNAALPEKTVFWDHNYALDPHTVGLSPYCDYRDGLELLKLQAKEALRIWEVLL